MSSPYQVRVHISRAIANLCTEEDARKQIAGGLFNLTFVFLTFLKIILVCYCYFSACCCFHIFPESDIRGEFMFNNFVKVINLVTLLKE